MKSLKFALLLLVSTFFGVTAIAAPPAGELDPSFSDGGARIIPFNVGGNLDDAPYAMVQGSADRLLVAGFGAVEDASKKCLAMVRLSADGALDTGFGVAQTPGKVCHGDFLGSAKVLNFGMGLATRPDGDFFVAGAFNKAGNLRTYICRFKPDGTFREGFGHVATPGCYLHEEGPTYFAPRALVLKDGSVIVVSNTANAPMVFRVNQETGDLEPFGDQSQVPVLHESVQGTANARNALLTPDGDLIVVGDIKGHL